MKICLIGCGFIGNALKIWLEKHNPGVELLISDPAKGYSCNVNDEKIEAYFIQVHVPTLADGKQDVKILEEIVTGLNKSCPIYIRTTITLETLSKLRELNPDVSFIPEFLTQRTAVDDFEKMDMVFTERPELLSEIFIGKRHVDMSSEEAILAKYAHNCFGALKVTYFNFIYDICRLNQLSYDNVLNGTLLSKYINAEHTAVPGPDGSLGYGGKCFPKDVKAFSAEPYQLDALRGVFQIISEYNDNRRQLS